MIKHKFKILGFTCKCVEIKKCMTNYNKIQQNIFLPAYVKYYDKMHYEEELELFCSCIRANISIMLHKKIYEINSTLLLRTHFKPPSSVCSNFLLRSHVEFGREMLLKYAIYILLYRCNKLAFQMYTLISRKSYTNHILS